MPENERKEKMKLILLYLIILLIFSVSIYQDIRNVFFGEVVYLTGPEFLIVDVFSLIAFTVIFIIILKEKQ